MAREPAIATLSRLAMESHGVFRGRDAVALDVSRRQLTRLRTNGVIERVLPDTYRLTAVARSSEQRLAAALAWAGDGAAAAGRSAGWVYGLEGVEFDDAEIVVPRAHRARAAGVIVHRPENPATLMLRLHERIRVTGVEPTLVCLAATLAAEDFEIACEDARRRRLTSVPALHAYLDRFGRRGKPRIGATRDLLRQLDPTQPARSQLEVKTRRLLVANGYGDFVREFPLSWNGRTYRYDFAFPRRRTILETNGRRWHDDPSDYELDHEKWSVPARQGYKLLFATWDKVVKRPRDLLRELDAALAAA